MLVDALSHLYDPRITDLPGLLLRARDADLSDIVLGGVDPLSDPASTPPAPDGLRLWSAFGIHPMSVGKAGLADQLRILRSKLNGPHVIAIGECGLDKRPGMPPMSAQISAFSAQLELACELDLPVILHQVRAMGPFLQLLQEPRFRNLRGMVHGYSGSAQSARQLVAQGLYISFGINLLSSRNRRARTSILEIPDDAVLVESDAPNHPPPNSPRALCEPIDIHAVLEEMSSLRLTPVQRIKEQIAINAQALFRFST